MTPRQVAIILRAWMNENKLTLSDLRKAQILLLNGRLGDGIPQERKPVLKAIRPSVAMNFDECTA